MEKNDTIYILSKVRRVLTKKGGQKGAEVWYLVFGSFFLKQEVNLNMNLFFLLPQFSCQSGGRKNQMDSLCPIYFQQIKIGI